MSRTHKTNPDWVGREWEPVHGNGCREAIGQSRLLRLRLVDPYEPCDLPDEPPHGPPIRVSWRGIVNGHGTRCAWWPDLPSAYRRPSSKQYPRGGRVGYAANRFERGVRTAWRDWAQQALAMPRGELDDIEPPDPRHRHFAMWDWWW